MAIEVLKASADFFEEMLTNPLFFLAIFENCEKN